MGFSNVLHRAQVNMGAIGGPAAAASFIGQAPTLAGFIAGDESWFNLSADRRRCGFGAMPPGQRGKRK
jgi:hypothetical protein